jgi:hypothetical protein
MTLYNEVTKEQNKNQRAGLDTGAIYAICAVLERRLTELKHELSTRKDQE